MDQSDQQFERLRALYETQEFPGDLGELVNSQSIGRSTSWYSRNPGVLLGIAAVLLIGLSIGIVFQFQRTGVGVGSRSGKLPTRDISRGYYRDNIRLVKRPRVGPVFIASRSAFASFKGKKNDSPVRFGGTADTRPMSTRMLTAFSGSAFSAGDAEVSNDERRKIALLSIPGRKEQLFADVKFRRGLKILSVKGSQPERSAGVPYSNRNLKAQRLRRNKKFPIRSLDRFHFNPINGFRS